MKTNCTSLYFLSTLACRLTECMEEKEIEILSTDLKTLGEMLESLLARRCDSTQDMVSSDISGV